jgi:hypothetical protein
MEDEELLARYAPVLEQSCIVIDLRIPFSNGFDRLHLFANAFDMYNRNIRERRVVGKQYAGGLVNKGPGVYNGLIGHFFEGDLFFEGKGRVPISLLVKDHEKTRLN